MTLAERVVRLSKLQGVANPVVSAYLNTRWTDEQQRERTRLFLKSEIQRARKAGAAGALAKALDWIEAEAEAVISQARLDDAQGVALFAGADLGLREVIPVRAPLENAVVVADRPFLRPLAAVVAESPPAAVVFVDGESARLIPVLDTGPGEEAHLDSVVPGHHRRGGWAQLAQSRYQRHIEARRGRHLEAVSDALGRLVQERDLERIVIAGPPDAAGALWRALPSAVAARVAGIMAAQRHEPASVLVARATDLIGGVVTLEARAALDRVLTEAAKGGQAAASLEGILEALQRGAVDHLYLLRTFRERGRACASCDALQPGDGTACRLCRETTSAVELGEAMVSRAIAAGGTATMIDAHGTLEAMGGVAARLRFAP